MKYVVFFFFLLLGKWATAQQYYTQAIVVDTDRDLRFTLVQGTTIKFPAGCFSTKKKKVTIIVKEPLSIPHTSKNDISEEIPKHVWSSDFKFSIEPARGEKFTILQPIEVAIPYRQFGPTEQVFEPYYTAGNKVSCEQCKKYVYDHGYKLDKIQVFSLPNFEQVFNMEINTFGTIDMREKIQKEHGAITQP
ncbi:hypothetical protein LX64_02309 [Chitinophaga skermanii]|uniref:Uncharacterized protein n=1 Tax=Chitinophaga skermanii TaxID=331697 RepID=A0A327QMQ6_9BACT|nr:hypothetical protein [Chitinophaga skermanii]RAJ05155.1 hypothetical protein LX64_02309 [Chitinophaga skermanii]